VPRGCSFIRVREVIIFQEKIFGTQWCVFDSNAKGGWMGDERWVWIDVVLDLCVFFLDSLCKKLRLELVPVYVRSR
jgi:hypothetical protein